MGTHLQTKIPGS